MYRREPTPGRRIASDPRVAAWLKGDGKNYKGRMDIGDRITKVSMLSWAIYVVFINSGPRISSLGLLATAIRDLDNFLMLEKVAPKKSAKKDPYDRTAFWSYCENRKAAFQKFYLFCFALAKPE